MKAHPARIPVFGSVTVSPASLVFVGLVVIITLAPIALLLIFS